MIRLFLTILTLCGAALPAAAQPLASGRNHIAAELVAESRAPVPGAPVTLAFSFTPEPGWHGYWENPGDAGQPLRVEWTLPPGVTAGPLRFPVPHRLLISGLMNYVFEGPHAILAGLRVAPEIASGTRLPLRARIDYLACTDKICVPERAELALELVAGDGRIASADQARFDGWRAALPQPLGTEASYERVGDVIRIAVPVPAGAQLVDAYFFPAAAGILDHGAPQAASRNGNAVVIEAKAAAGAAVPGEPIAGLLATGDESGLAFTATPGPVPAAGTPIGPPDGGLDLLLLAFLGAIAGGIVLNVMPCVFPILSLKALSLARAGEDARAARGEALAYAAGVVVTCLALGATLLALRAGGVAVGWAFQLQEPRLVLILLLLVTAVALNLAGLFRLPGLGLSWRGGAAGAFATGALAAFVATPCTGPFMAAALGATLVLPAWGALIVFGGLGLGLALPFVLIAFVPALRRRLPRPGLWMVRLQHILSVPMFLTALGLAWVLGRQTGIDGMTLGLAGALLLGLGLWWLGGSRTRWPALALIVLAVAAPLALLSPRPAAATAAGALPASEPFSEARLAALRAERRPVFLYFTADWCITCKVNENGAMTSAAVAQAFRERRIAVLVGDWTSGDAAITRFLERQGRAGVPLYLYYGPGAQPQVLPQMLGEDDLLALGG